jgi:uncharacterized membrane protein YozB (DUF420 family)
MDSVHLSSFAAHPLVHVNASLNAAATVLLVVGYLLIKRGRVEAHKSAMLAAFGVSTVFLACYLYYHYQVGSVSFTHAGAVRYVYLSILASHVVLAFTVPWLAIWTIYLGLRATGCCMPAAGSKPDSSGFMNDINQQLSDRRFENETVSKAVYREQHRRWAWWTFPIWLYVSVTGVVVYLMLYHLWPPAGP